jgi:hypothetical protein
MQQEIKTTNDTHAPQSYKSFIFYFEMNKTFSHMSKNGRTIIKNYFYRIIERRPTLVQHKIILLVSTSLL